LSEGSEDFIKKKSVDIYKKVFDNLNDRFKDINTLDLFQTFYLSLLKSLQASSEKYKVYDMSIEGSRVSGTK